MSDLFFFLIDNGNLEWVSLFRDNDRSATCPGNIRCRTCTKSGRNRPACSPETCLRNSCRPYTNCFRIRAFFPSPSRRHIPCAPHHPPWFYWGRRSRASGRCTSRLRTSSRGCEGTIPNEIANQVSPAWMYVISRVIKKLCIYVYMYMITRIWLWFQNYDVKLICKADAFI